jgi:preprotein translocase subunit SecA
MSLFDRALNVGEAKKFKEYQKRVALINAFEAELEHDSDAELRTRMDELRARAVDGDSLDALLPECFAIVRETGKRTMGMRHFDVQMIGGMALNEGQIAEMKTGEGKTLTATLAVVLNSLAVRERAARPAHEGAAADGETGPQTERKGVHVVTVNDYLARRDAEWMSPIYDALGVSVGVLQSNQPYDDKQRAYACDVVYGTNSEFGFDYLRDNMAKDLSEKVQRGHPFAIVDEVDNILIDEARTPLIISGAPEQAADLYVKFARLAPRLQVGETPEGMDPRMKKQFMADFDYEIDEKQKTVAITEQGVAKAERFLGIDHLYRAENGHLVNHLIQSLRAEALYKRDVDYAVIDGEVKIIDEFTGRILDGRRWSEGLHQAVEAKEGVAVQEENQTLATITYQNYFRLYDKLSGMTGTALTEATEFMKIYDLPVVQIPTNMDMVRADRNDQVYKTKEGKWNAVVKEIGARHETGQPVLVGTISVEVSELLGQRLAKRGIKHTVLNAKPEHAALEAETVAEAGQPGAVTIATNMAGRGVDIKLGGNPEHLARQQLAREGLKADDDPDAYQRRMADVLPALEREVEEKRQQVMAVGGLFICGTERHESRRIDNQLRGRAGRQGDPGESRFFLSAEDDLVRLFAGDRIYRILDKLGGVDDEGNEEPIEAGMLSKQIEKAQKKVEEQNFLIRKRVLEYDDVMNEQRRVIYAYRDEVLEGKSISEEAREQVANVIERMVDQYTPGDFVEDWDMDGLYMALGQLFPLDGGELAGATSDRTVLVEAVTDEATKRYDAREQALGEELMGALERFLLLQTIDERWREHLFDMDYLREGIHLRGFAQIDPLVAYKNEAFTLFGDLMNTVWSDYARMIFNVQVNVEGGPNGGGPGAGGGTPFPAAGSSTRAGRVSYSGGHSAAGAGALAAAAANAGLATGSAQAAFGEGGQEAEAMPVVEQRVLADEQQVGRNDPCWCGSGKKFKKCHGA